MTTNDSPLATRHSRRKTRWDSLRSAHPTNNWPLTTDSRGLTLLEMLIVLAILVAMMALGWPALRRPYAKAQVRDAARLVRGELAKARLAAIESGIPQMFRFQPGTGLFEIMPQASLEQEQGPSYGNSISEAIQSNQADASTTTGPDPYDEQTWQQTLPHRITFFAQRAAETEEIETDGVADTLVEQISTESESESWSPPMVFYPNGRTTNARIRLTNSRDYYVDVDLRGLTGLATVGRVERIVVDPAVAQECLTATGEESVLPDSATDDILVGAATESGP